MSDKNVLKKSTKLQLKLSKIEGFGVFASDFIPKGEVLEEIPFILFHRNTILGKALYNLLETEGFLSEKEKSYDNLRQNLKFKDPDKYYFKWYPKVLPEPNFTGYQVLPLGYGPIYNTSNTCNNANWEIGDEIFTFFAEKDIQKDEEICTFYGYFLDENGEIYNPEQVFYMALDYDKDKDTTFFKMLRFNHSSQLEKSKKDASCVKFLQAIQNSQDGLVITKISAVTADGKEFSPVQIAGNSKLSVLYKKIFEYKHSIYPFTRFEYYYIDKESNIKTDSIIVKN